LRIILSDTSVPGEGEHKIIEFIREERRKPDYDGNTSHCIYGNDADLILLSLLTHEPRIALFREENGMNNLVYISKLREYIEIEFLNKTNLTAFPFDLERILDDFIFLTLFLGNDYIPEQTGLDVHGGYFDSIIEIYQETLSNECTDYITHAGRVNWAQAEKLFAKLADY